MDADFFPKIEISPLECLRRGGGVRIPPLYLPLIRRRIFITRKGYRQQRHYTLLVIIFVNPVKSF